MSYTFFQKIHRSVLLALLAVLPFAIFGQTTQPARPAITPTVDSVTKTLPADSLKNITTKKDSVIVPARPDTSLQAFYGINPYVNTKAPLIFKEEVPFIPIEKDLIFYILGGVLLALGAIRLLFSKYFSDLFRIFFQTNFRQKSIREQLLQNKTGSLFMNVFFCLSGGLFLYFVALHRGWLPEAGFLQKASLCVGLIGAVYFVKYIVLQICGWLFGMSEVAETYLFIVFLINKVAGVLLLPATIILALGSQSVQPVLLTISLLFVGFIYLYRYIIALPLVRTSSGMTGFHFFVYLCAFEIVPILVIYKLLLLTLAR